jgi:tRNA(fMet)-specific endonuclease VapC
MDMLMLDTCFLIDYQREASARRQGAVAAFLKLHAQSRLQISTIAWGEFLAGFNDGAHPFIAFARDRLDVLELASDVAFVYRAQYRRLKASGNLIGANDLWIGCHALTRGIPLVSRNQSDFQRILELKVETY